MECEQFVDKEGWKFRITRRKGDGEIIIEKKKRHTEFSPIIYIPKRIARNIAGFIDRTDTSDKGE